jgi:GNAT superfamily N-acetyltransferase
MHEPITNRLQVIEGNQADYYRLARYHYEPQLTFPPTKVFKVVGNEQYAAHFPDPVAVIVFIQPFPDITARNKATGGFFKQHKSNAENLQLLNAYVLYCARLITDPRYLRKGIATYLLKETLCRLTCPIVETLTPIDFTNRMYTKAGFELYYTPAPKKFTRLINAFREVGLDVHDITCRELIDMRLNALNPTCSAYIEKEIALFLSGFRNAERFKPSPARTKFILSKIPPPQAYLIWFNPNAILAKTILLHRENTAVKNNQPAQSNAQ